MIVLQKAEVIEEIRSKIKIYGITPKDLGLSDKSSQRAGVIVPIKYRQGDQTWTGRGRQPKWVEDYLAAGGSLDTVRIK